MTLQRLLTLLLAAVIVFGGLTSTLHAQDDPEACAAVLPSRLAVGGAGRVMGDTPVNVRGAPAPDGAWFGQIPGGAVFAVVEGPVCAAGFVWWRVDYDGLVGWTVEGAFDGTYFVEPADSPTAQPTPAPDPVPAAPVEDAPLWLPIDALAAADVLPLAVIEPVTAYAYDVAWSPFGVMLAIAGEGGAWGANPDIPAPPLPLADLPGAEALAVAFDAEGLFIAVAGSDGAVSVWDVESGAAVSAWPAHEGAAQAVAYHPAGSLIASGGADGYAVLTDAASALPVHTVEIGAAVTGVAFNADGALLAVGAEDGTVRVIDAASGGEIAALPPAGGPVYDVAFSPAGDVLAAAGCVNAGCIIGEVRLWETGAYTALRTLSGQGAGTVAVAFSPAGDVIASGGGDGAVMLWDAARGDRLATLTGHTARVTAVAFSADGGRIASADESGAVRLWGQPGG